MRNMLVIARRELRSYFDSPIAYIVVVAFLGVVGWLYFSALFMMGRADMRAFFEPSPFSPAMLLVVIVPAVTMRLIAEERKTGTIELLTTLPIRDWEVILGKFTAAMGLVASALAVTFVYALSVAFIGPLDWGPVVGGYLGMLLFSGMLAAVGLLCSTWTRNQIAAFIVGFIVCAGLYFMYWLDFFLPGWLAPIAHYLSPSFHLENLARGVIDSRDVIYYLSVTAAVLVLAERSLARQHV